MKYVYPQPQARKGRQGTRIYPRVAGHNKSAVAITTIATAVVPLIRLFALVLHSLDDFGQRKASVSGSARATAVQEALVEGDDEGNSSRAFSGLLAMLRASPPSSSYRLPKKTAAVRLIKSTPSRRAHLTVL